MRRIEAIEAIQGFARVSSNPYLLDWGAGQRLLSTMASGGALCESSGEGSEVTVGFSLVIAASSWRVRANVVALPSGNSVVGIGAPNVTLMRGRCIM